MVARGTHPNSLANLRPWTSETKPNPTGERGPIITPVMRKYAMWTFTELADLAASPKANQLPMADVIAITSLLKAAKEVEWGDKAREMVISRLDGEPAKTEITLNDNRTYVREVHTTQEVRLG